MAAARSRARVDAALRGALASAGEADAIGRATLEELSRQREVIDAASAKARYGWARAGCARRVARGGRKRAPRCEHASRGAQVAAVNELASTSAWLLRGMSGFSGRIANLLSRPLDDGCVFMPRGGSIGGPGLQSRCVPVFS